MQLFSCQSQTHIHSRNILQTQCLNLPKESWMGEGVGAKEMPWCFSWLTSSRLRREADRLCADVHSIYTNRGHVWETTHRPDKSLGLLPPLPISKSLPIYISTKEAKTYTFNNLYFITGVKLVVDSPRSLWIVNTHKITSLGASQSFDKKKKKKGRTSQRKINMFGSVGENPNPLLHPPLKNQLPVLWRKLALKEPI